jgi:hypothetical protein
VIWHPYKISTVAGADLFRKSEALACVPAILPSPIEIGKIQK